LWLVVSSQKVVMTSGVVSFNSQVCCAAYKGRRNQRQSDYAGHAKVREREGTNFLSHKKQV